MTNSIRQRHIQLIADALEISSTSIKPYTTYGEKHRYTVHVPLATCRLLVTFLKGQGEPEWELRFTFPKNEGYFYTGSSFSGYSLSGLKVVFSRVVI